MEASISIVLHEEHEEASSLNIFVRSVFRIFFRANTSEQPEQCLLIVNPQQSSSAFFLSTVVQ